MSLDPKVTDQGNKVRLDWTPDLSCQGYRLYIDGVAVSRTFKPDARSTTFAKPSSGPHRYGVRKMDVVDVLEEATFPEPPPSSAALGLCLNAAPSAAWLARAATLKPRYVREDVISQEKVDWAENNAAFFIGCCNLANAGLATSMAKVNQWPQIKVWELDNEPYFDGVSIPTYAPLTLQLAQQIKAAHPGHKVILPMFIQTNGGDYQTNGQWSPYATQMLNAAPGLVGITDYISGHAYDQGVAPSKVFQTLDKVQGQLRAKGLDKPWHITECGWSVGTADSRQVSQAQQAQYTDALIAGLRTRLWVESIELYCLQTWGTGYYESFGLFNQDMSDRPAAQVYRNLN